MLGREMRWRTPGWMFGLLIFDALGEVVGEAYRAGQQGVGGAEMLGDLPAKVTHTCTTFLSSHINHIFLSTPIAYDHFTFAASPH